MGIYERIKDIALSKGYSINRLEKEIGLPRSSIGKYNKNVPGMDKIQRIADFLGVSISELTGEAGYYLDNETARVAQEIFENKELRALFSVERDMKPEDLKALHTMALALKRKEGYDGDDPA